MFQENHKSVLLNPIINAQVNICTYLKNKKKKTSGLQDISYLK